MQACEKLEEILKKESPDVIVESCSEQQASCSQEEHTFICTENDEDEGCEDDDCEEIQSCRDIEQLISGRNEKEIEELLDQVQNMQ